MYKKLRFIILASGLVLSACSTGSKEENNGSKDKKEEKHMEHKSESKTPDDMKRTDDSKFKKGDEVTITAGHMPGMKNAKGTVKGAYKTYAYVVSYTPENGDKKVNNHKWVVNEEVADAPKNGFKKGDTVKLEADHMPGMKGAEAQIDDVEKTTVYMVDYKSTENDKMVKNHKWMTTDELKSR
ncbi:YdhK family protein [Staphylococcus warneri]|uniref:YdhK family protein n=1 Tax=Staphylococcus warneri TaxID=1292 RepID=UPI0021A2DF20|nr:YdhK family protein [Staphylococcus warneri]MCT2597074.1 YdhK family protein [Staphylococcus warneri]